MAAAVGLKDNHEKTILVCHRRIHLANDTQLRHLYTVFNITLSCQINLETGNFEELCNAQSIILLSYAFLYDSLFTLYFIRDSSGFENVKKPVKCSHFV